MKSHKPFQLTKNTSTFTTLILVWIISVMNNLQLHHHLLCGDFPHRLGRRREVLEHANVELRHSAAATSARRIRGRRHRFGVGLGCGSAPPFVQGFALLLPLHGLDGRLLLLLTIIVGSGILLWFSLFPCSLPTTLTHGLLFSPTCFVCFVRGLWKKNCFALALCSQSLNIYFLRPYFHCPFHLPG